MTQVFDTPEAINAFRMLSVHGRLKLEMKGLRFRINTFSFVRRELGLPSRTPRTKVLAAWEQKMDELGIKYHAAH
jgi:hypothetical protein